MSRFNAKLSRRKLDALWREVILLRDKRTCQWCGTLYGVMQAHHLFHKNAYPAGRYLIANGRCLCRRCHFTLHQNRETAYLAEVVASIGLEAFLDLKAQCSKTRGSYNAAQFERDLKDLNDRLVLLGGCTE